MKAYYYQTIVCPECGRFMLPDREANTVKCAGEGCALKDVEYHAPSTELVPVDRPSKVEYIIIKEEDGE